MAYLSARLDLELTLVVREGGVELGRVGMRSTQVERVYTYLLGAAVDVSLVSGPGA